jgi:hypothetical protein
MVRIQAVRSWSWADNSCTVLLDGAWFDAPLPPIAAPIVDYTVETSSGQVTSWLHGPPRLDTDASAVLSVLCNAERPALEAARTVLSLPSSASAEDILRKAESKDTQISPTLGEWRGLFDSLSLKAEQRRLLLDNHRAFGRSHKRRLKRPHCVVFPSESDAPELHHEDFSRSGDPELRRKARSAGVWRAVRLARAAGCPIDPAYVADSYGAEAVETLRADTDAFVAAPVPALPTVSPAAAWRMHTVVVHGISVNALFAKAPGEAADETHWFASCFGAAAAHPSGVSFLKTRPALRPIRAYACHERLGCVYVTSCVGGVAMVPQAVPTGGLRFVAHPTAAEGGCHLFTPGLKAVGIFCPKGNGATWTRALVQNVAALLHPAGVIHTNCSCTRFLDFLRI